MITVTATPTQTQPQRTTKMTVDEYLALDELEGGWELVDGVLQKMAKPNLDHQHLLALICQGIRACLNTAAPRLGLVLLDVDVRLSPFRVAEPDLVYVRAERSHLLQGVIVAGAPDLVLEILSTDRSKDLIRNRQWYAQAGIPEYWILDPVHDTLTILELAGGGYIERAVLNRNDTLTTPTIPALSIPLTELFDDPDRALLRQP